MVNKMKLKKAERKKYDYMESRLNVINQRFISIPDEEGALNSEILLAVVHLIIPEMQKQNILFRNLLLDSPHRFFCGGSFYDGLKVGRADEFDLDLLLQLPASMMPTVSLSTVRSFLHVRLNALERSVHWDKESKAKMKTCLHEWGLASLLDTKGFLQTGKVYRWMEGVLDKALHSFPYSIKGYKLDTTLGTFHVKSSKDDPAFTLSVHGIIDKKIIEFKIDLVPCFSFGQDQWPSAGFKPNLVPSKPGFFLVPKPSDKALINTPNKDRCWRASFQEQEREIIHDKGFLKPALKLLKKLTTTQKHNIASYHLKTVLLWQAKYYRRNWRWDRSLSYTFMTILNDYLRCLKQGRISYFWNRKKKRNFLANLSDEEVSNITGRIQRIVDDVENNLGDASVIAKYLLTPEELAMFCKSTRLNVSFSL